MCLVTIAGLLIGMLCVEATTKSFDQYIYDLREVQLGKWGETYLQYYVNNNNSWSGVAYYTQVPSLYDPFSYFTNSGDVVLSLTEAWICITQTVSILAAGSLQI